MRYTLSKKSTAQKLGCKENLLLNITKMLIQLISLYHKKLKHTIEKIK